jgi:hypothetical protein
VLMSIQAVSPGLRTISSIQIYLFLSCKRSLALEVFGMGTRCSGVITASRK